MTSPSPIDRYQRQREEMVRLQIEGRGIHDILVLNAMRSVPRHEFVPQELRQNAYEDRPLPIGQGQTISQPYIVALMLEYLVLRQSDRALEVGSGSGYATALLSRLSGEVFAIERIGALADSSEETLQRLDFRNVHIKVADGRQGWAESAPFDAILVSAATADVPPNLFSQLCEGGRMILPVGPPSGQQLQLVRKIGGRIEVRALEGCRFVPLVGLFPE